VKIAIAYCPTVVLLAELQQALGSTAAVIGAAGALSCDGQPLLLNLTCRPAAPVVAEPARSCGPKSSELHQRNVGCLLPPPP
jgi:hypothetical protein